MRQCESALTAARRHWHHRGLVSVSAGHGPRRHSEKGGPSCFFSIIRNLGSTDPDRDMMSYILVVTRCTETRKLLSWR